jgi:hypothetical protein
MIESIRVLSHKNCGFINYYTQEEAIRAKRSCHNKEIMGPGTGTVRIGFAKVPPINLKVEDVIVAQQQQHQQQQQQQQQQILTLMEDNLGNKSPFTPIPNTNYASMMDDQQHMMMYMMEMMNTPSSSNTNAMYSAVATERKLIMQEFGEDDSDGPMFDGKQSLIILFFLCLLLILKLNSLKQCFIYLQVIIIVFLLLPN